MDLVFLAPGDKVVVVEVKGTLVARRIPRSHRDSADVYGGVVVVNFADLVWRAAVTFDFSTLMPISEAAQLANLDWLR